jgi:hypothetical protein
VIYAKGGAPATAGPAAAALAVGDLLFSDNFTRGTANWIPELEAGGTITAADGAMTIDVPAGATVWFKPMLEGPVMIEYHANVASNGGRNDRVSDLNCFWMARDSTGMWCGIGNTLS